jgi:Tol biopolymer transport system component
MRRIWLGVAILIGLMTIPIPASATFPGGNGKIAFFDAHADVPQISSVEPDGSALEQLTDGARAAQYPAYSADGSMLAFVRSRGIEEGRHAIVTMGADGSDPAVVFRARDGRKEILAPAWSPDGGQIVFCAEGRRPPALFVIDADGSDLTKISRAGHLDCHPSWSPDGTTIAFATLNFPNIAIATMDTDGTNRSVLVGRGWNDDPDWSPDGSQVVFFRAVGSDRTDIFTVGADGTGRRRITDTPGRWEWTPTFAPDGQRIAFARSQTARIAAPGDIFTVAAVGGDQERVTDTEGVDEFWLTWQPVEG